MMASHHLQSFENQDFPINLSNDIKLVKKNEKYVPMHLRPKTSRIPNRPKTDCACHVHVACLDVSQEKKRIPQNSIKAPKSARKTMNFAYKSELPKTVSKIPNSNEIKKMEMEIKASRPKSILWGESSHSMNSIITKEITSETPAKQSKVINDLHEKLDISVSIPPSKLISTTAYIQDYIGVPNSLAFIR